MQNIQIYHPEIISVEDFFETDNSTVFINESGDQAIIINPETCLVIRK